MAGVITPLSIGEIRFKDEIGPVPRGIAQLVSMARPRHSVTDRISRRGLTLTVE